MFLDWWETMEMNLTPPVARVLEWGGAESPEMETESYETSQWETFEEELEDPDLPDSEEVTFTTWVRDSMGQWVLRPVSLTRESDPGSTAGVEGIQALWRGYSLRKKMKKVYTIDYLRLLTHPVQGIKRKRWQRDM